MTERVVLITGGSRGIGGATALKAAQAGYRVGISYQHNASAAHSLVQRIEVDGGTAFAVRANIASEEDILRLFRMVEGRLGPITALVNNAGTVERQARVDQIDSARLHRLLNANVVGTFLCAREAVRRMSTRNGGRGGAIVNVSSRAAVLGSPNEFVDYAMSKAAVDTLTVGLAKEVATEGVRVNAVRPGLIETELHAARGEPGRVARLAPSVPMERGGTPEEVAEAILWLLSDAASYITGTILDVAGGR